MIRGSPTCEVMRPKFEELKFVVGAPQLKWFSRLNVSRPQLQPLRPDGNELRNRRNAVQHIKQMTVNQDALDAMNPPRRVRCAARDYTSALSVFKALAQLLR